MSGSIRGRRSGGKLRIGAAVAGITMGIVGIGAASPAEAAPPGCQEIVWGAFGNQLRLICDGPRNPDGSWMRNRVIGIPAGYRNGSSQCYGGAILAGYTWGFSNCQNSPSGYYPQVTFSDDHYLVFPNNVLPDEPGYLG